MRRAKPRRFALPLAHYFDPLPKPIAEWQFHKTRKWKFDLAWPERRVALEQEGGVWIRGRHNRGGGMIADMEKYNAAALLGWRVFRFTPQQVQRGEAAAMMREALK